MAGQETERGTIAVLLFAPTHSAVNAEFRFFRRKRARGLKNADMLIPLGVTLQDSKAGGQHVHEPVVPCIRHLWLPVPAH
jgi:hypothetical protein